MNTESLLRGCRQERVTRTEVGTPGFAPGGSIWAKEPSRFDWSYDSQEECLFLEGEVIIHAGGKQVKIRAGDFVTFPRGLKCTWEVLKQVRKHYRFA